MPNQAVLRSLSRTRDATLLSSSQRKPLRSLRRDPAYVQCKTSRAVRGLREFNAYIREHGADEANGVRGKRSIPKSERLPEAFASEERSPVCSLYAPAIVEPLDILTGQNHLLARRVCMRRVRCRRS